MVDTLREIHDILVRQGHAGQAEFVDELINLHGTDPDRFRTLVQSVGMWGGSGAVWEVGQLGEDKQRFQEHIIRLAHQMEHADLGMDRSRAIAATFASWRAKGL